MTAAENDTRLRKTGLRVVGDLPWGTHFCHFYETQDDLLDILVPYFKAGLENHEFCMWVVCDPLNVEEATNALREAVPGADHHLATGGIEIVPHHFLFDPSPRKTSTVGGMEILSYSDWYLKGGGFELDRVMNGWREKLAEALAKGYAGMRVNGNEAWLTKEDWKDFLRYEQRLDETLAGQQMLVLCSYPLATSGAAEVLDVVRTHQFAIARRNGEWEVIEMPELKEAKSEIKKLNDELEERVNRRTSELMAVNVGLRREIAERRAAEEKLHESREQLRRLSRRLDSLREEERARISREIHDELGSKLTALKMDLSWLERKLGGLENFPARNTLLDHAVGATELVEEIIAGVQEIAAELRPGVLDKLGLGAAMQYEARRFQERTAIRCEVRLPDKEVIPSSEGSTALFRIFQECLTNVARHARASKVEAELKLDDSSVVLQVRDNGRGITDSEITDGKSLGLLGMRERASLLGGEIRFQRGLNGGTVVMVRIPQLPARLRTREDPCSVC